MKTQNTNKDRAKEYIEDLKKLSLGCFRVYISQFLLSVLQHRPSWNGWLPFVLGVVILHSMVAIPQGIVEILRFLSGFCLVLAMSALGLQVDIKKFIEFGSKAFVLSSILFGILIFGGFLLVYYCV